MTWSTRGKSCPTARRSAARSAGTSRRSQLGRTHTPKPQARPPRARASDLRCAPPAGLLAAAGRVRRARPGPAAGPVSPRSRRRNDRRRARLVAGPHPRTGRGTGHHPVHPAGAARRARPAHQHAARRQGDSTNRPRRRGTTAMAGPCRSARGRPAPASRPLFSERTAVLAWQNGSCCAEGRLLPACPGILEPGRRFSCQRQLKTDQLAAAPWSVFSCRRHFTAAHDARPCPRQMRMSGEQATSASGDQMCPVKCAGLSANCYTLERRSILFSLRRGWHDTTLFGYPPLLIHVAVTTIPGFSLATAPASAIRRSGVHS